MSKVFTVNLEIVGTCNLKCPSCAVGNYEGKRNLGSIGGTMPIEQFRAIIGKLAIDLCDYEDVLVTLYSWGEPLIHPKIGEFVSLAKAAGFRVGISSNLNRERFLADAVAAKPDEFVVSLSGFYPEIYSKTHVGGNIDRVKANMRRLSQLVREHGNQTSVYVNYHCYRHNSGEDIIRMAELCDELKFGFVPSIAYYLPIENMLRVIAGNMPSNDRPIIENLLVPIDEQIRIAKAKANKANGCTLLEDRMDIDVDGAVKLCCSSYERIYNVAPDYIKASIEDISQDRHDSRLCVSCFKHGLNRLYTLEDYSEWQTIANVSLQGLGSPLSFADTGPQIANANTESLVLARAINAMNAGDLAEADQQRHVLHRILLNKYQKPISDIISSVISGGNYVFQRGVDIPLDLMQICFLEGVLLRNLHGKLGEAREIFNQIILTAPSLKRDAVYAPVVEAIMPAAQTWHDLPIS